MTTTTTTNLATPVQRVDAGARFLDRVVPDWYARVDLDRLDVASHDDCVLAQVFDGSYQDALRTAFESHGREGWLTDFAVHHGFAVYDHDVDRFRAGSLDDLFRLIAGHWYVEVVARRHETRRLCEAATVGAGRR